MEDECTICLESLFNCKLGIITQCKHFYHDNCILTWSKNSNSCPTCRKLFYSINITEKLPKFDHIQQIIDHIRNLNHHDIVNTISVTDRLLPNDAINDIPREYITPATNRLEVLPSDDNVNHGICSICSSSDYRSSRNLITCSNCNCKFHQRCLGITANGDDINDWNCPICDYYQELIIPRRLPINRRNNNRISRPRNTLNTHSNILSSHLHQLRNLSESTSGIISDVIEPEPESEPRQRRETRGLIIHNEHGELDDEFLYNSSSMITPPVVNGGVILRKENKQREKLTDDEIKSWEVFEKIQNNEVLDVSGGDAGTRRRRKRKTTRTANTINTDGAGSPESNRILSEGSSNGHSRILNLMDQIRHRPESSIHAQIGSSTGGGSPSGGSPSGGSPKGGNVEEGSIESPHLVGSPDSTNSNTMDSTINTGSPRFIPNESLSPTVEVNGLTFDQKSIIQFFIRNNLRSLYRDKIIKNEEDYININKSISRRIYRKVLDLVREGFKIDDILNKDNENFQNLVNGYIEIELLKYKQ